MRQRQAQHQAATPDEGQAVAIGEETIATVVSDEAPELAKDLPRLEKFQPANSRAASRKVQTRPNKTGRRP
jgi:hypothetical protein